MEELKEIFIAHTQSLQSRICDAVASKDGQGSFTTDQWSREGGGGGITRVLEKGSLLEKAGVNTSAVYGEVTELMRKQLNVAGEYFFAAGISLIIHPYNPFVPTVHANFRYFELYDGSMKIIDNWFGGGADLTPYYLFDEDASHFHNTYKTCCDSFDKDFYPLFKKNCDDYFVNTHRDNERRGIGGIFFDHLRDKQNDVNGFWPFVEQCGEVFLSSYLPLVTKRKDHPYTQEHKYWQEVRRGRYVEFNLLHDRGTLFGLKTNGRTESILISLPPTVRFDYHYRVLPGSEEERLTNICLQPRDWV